MGAIDVPGYLRRLGLDEPGAPALAGLFDLHRAHVHRVPYTTLDIHLGRSTSVDPAESAARVVRTGRAGYCFHNNGAFASLLDALGYDVRWHVGAVQRRTDAEPPGRVANHLALTVHGLPSDTSPSGEWLVDVGLGDALYEPLPLVAGTYRQDPLELELAPSRVAPGGWRLVHDVRGGFAAMDFWPDVAGPADFAASHAELSTSPSSGFVQVFVVSRRTGRSIEVLKGCVLRTIGADGAVTETEATARSAWFETVVEQLGLRLDDVTEQQREALWQRVRSAHDAWVAVGRP